MKMKLLLVVLLAVGFVAMFTFGIGFFVSRQIVSRISRPTVTPTVVQENPDWRKQEVPNIGLQLLIPKELSYREELADDYGKIRTMAFYLENTDQSKPAYQMYALYQANTSATETDLEKAKTEMDPATIKEISIDGYAGIEGVIVGPKARYISVIIKNGQLFSVSTTPVTAENKKLTDEILATFDFQ